jgi:nucleotide-binding universal stress UspA family protein
MKRILVPIDFSEPAENAARYALQLAKYLKADMTLCNVFLLPVTVPATAQVSLPGYEYDTLKEENRQELEVVAKRLRIAEKTLPAADFFHPAIECISEAGGVKDVILQIAEDKRVEMVVMGMTGAGPVSRFLFGSVSREMIDNAELPLLLVPSGFLFQKIGKIAFATDLSESDIDVIHSLSGLARYFNADLVVIHITKDKQDDEAHQKKADSFLNDITCKVNYDKIYYRHMLHTDVEKGLDWVSENDFVDMLVMVHRNLSFIGRLFNFSHTHKKTNHLKVPLLILPAGLYPVF